MARLHSAPWIKEIIPELVPQADPYPVHDNPHAAEVGRYFLADIKNEGVMALSKEFATHICRSLVSRGSDGKVRLQSYIFSFCMICRRIPSVH